MTTNIVTGNARVGFQADGPVTIHGGLSISMDSTRSDSPQPVAAGDTGTVPDSGAVQDSAANVADGSDVVAVQAARIDGRR